MSRTLTYEIDSQRDFRPLLRLLRWHRRLAYAIVLGSLLFVLAPLLVAAVWFGPGASVPIGVGLAAVFVMMIMASHSRMRLGFDQQCFPRTLTLHGEALLTESEHGWLRCHWSWIRRVDVVGNWVGLRHDNSPNYLVLIPRRSWESDAAMRDFCDDVGGRIRAAAPSVSSQPGAPPTSQRADSATAATAAPAELAAVDFQLTTDELGRAVTHEIGSDASRSGWSILLLTASLSFLLLVFVGGDTAAGLFFAGAMCALYSPYALARPVGMARRWLMQKIFADPILRVPHRIAVTPQGLRIASADVEAMHSWRHFVEILESRRLIAFRTNQMTLFVVPKRAFADGAGEAEFLQAARESLLQQREKEAAAAPPTPAREETGNPYQAPLQ